MGVQTGTASWKSGWVVSGEVGGPCSVIPDICVCVFLESVLGVEWGGQRDPSTGAPPFFRNEGKRSFKRQMRKLKLRLSDLSF